MIQRLINIATHLWNSTIEVSPYPPIRSVEVAFVRIYKKIGARKEFVGCFVPELYLLANTENGSLRCQIEAQIWIKKRHQKNLSYSKNHLRRLRPELYQNLYHPDGTSKTAFELAIVPCHKLVDIEKAVANEFRYRRNHLLALPPLVSRYRILPDYLQPDEHGTLGNSGLSIGNINKDKPNTLRVNVWNLPHKATSREKIIHFLFNVAAILEVLCLAAGFTGASSTLGLFVAIPAIVLAVLCAKACTMFEVAESVYRELRWLFSPEFRPTKGKLSITNLALSLVKFSAIALVIYGLTTTQWAQILALPWAALNEMGLNASIVAASKYTLAIFLTSIGCITSWIGLSLTTRYIWGFSIYDNRIPFTKDLSKNLPIIPKGTSNSKSLANHKRTPTSKSLTKSIEFTQRAFTFRSQTKRHPEIRPDKYRSKLR